MNQSNENQPKQVYIDKGLFKTKQFAINTKNGTKIKITTYITGKGQKYFIDKIGEDYKNENTYKYI